LHCIEKPDSPTVIRIRNGFVAVACGPAAGRPSTPRSFTLAQQGAFSLQAYDSVAHAHPFEQLIRSPVGDVVTTMLKEGATPSPAPTTGVDSPNAAAAKMTAAPVRCRATRPPFGPSAEHWG